MQSVVSKTRLRQAVAAGADVALRASTPAVREDSSPGARAETVRAFFFVTAPVDPGLLPRLIEPVAKLGAVPSRVHASRESGDGSELTVDLRLAGVAPRTAELIEYALRAVVGVRQVLAVVEPES
jgi:hypothetical protein